MTKVRFLLSVLITVTFASQPSVVLADWQYSRWGMTVEEVKDAVTKSGTTLKPYKSWSNSPPSPRYLVSTTYDSGDYQFDAYFFFKGDDQKLLQTVELVLKDKQKCPALNATLESLYGAPRDTANDSEKKMGLRYYEWLDKEKYNKVSLMFPPMRYTDPCVVSYQEIVKPGSTKGL